MYAFTLVREVGGARWRAVACGDVRLHAATCGWQKSPGAEPVGQARAGVRDKFCALRAYSAKSPPMSLETGSSW